jgi:hypothetical protein
MSAIEELGTTLPIGFSYKETAFSEFELGDVKGRLRREYLNIRKRSPARETLVAIKHVLTRLGPINKPDEATIKRLTLPDIDYMFLLISAKESETGEIKWEATCGDSEEGQEIVEGGCGAVLEVAVNPYDVALLKANPEIEFSNLGEPIQKTEFTDPATGRSIPIIWKIPTLGDQIKLFDKLSNSKNAEFGNLLFYQMVSVMLDYDGKGRGLTVAELDELPVRTVDALLEYNKLHKPTQLDTEVEVTCQQCGTEHLLELPLEEWTIPFANRGLSQT